MVKKRKQNDSLTLIGQLTTQSKNRRHLFFFWQKCGCGACKKNMKNYLTLYNWLFYLLSSLCLVDALYKLRIFVL